jgi:hypothetical protein
MVAEYNPKFFYGLAMAFKRCIDTFFGVVAFEKKAFEWWKT